MLKLSIGRGTEEKRQVKFSWREDVSLEELSELVKYNALAIPKYKYGWRKKSNVIDVGNVIFLDIDRDENKEPSSDAEVDIERANKIRNMYTIDEILPILDKSGYSYLIYPSRNNNPDAGKHKFRVVLPTDGKGNYLLNIDDKDFVYDSMVQMILKDIGLDLDKVDDAAFSLTQYMESWGYIKDGEEYPGATDFFTILRDTGKVIETHDVASRAFSFEPALLKSRGVINYTKDEFTNEWLVDIYEQFIGEKHQCEARVAHCHLCGGTNENNPYGHFTWFPDSQTLYYKCWACGGYSKMNRDWYEFREKEKETDEK